MGDVLGKFEMLPPSLGSFIALGEKEARIFSCFLHDRQGN